MNENTFTQIADKQAKEIFEKYKEEIYPFLFKIYKITNEYYQAPFNLLVSDIGEHLCTRIGGLIEDVILVDEVTNYIKVKNKIKLKKIL